ncbi:MAG: outer membrane beta-barrel protein, partial [Allopontixanthobacter sediminis]
MKKVLIITGAVSALAVGAMPAAAQDTSPVYFDGIYIGGAGGYDIQSNDGGDTLVFDTDQNGVYGDSVNTTTGANAFSPGFCNGRAIGSTAAAGCTSDEDDWAYAARIGADTRMGGGPVVVGVLLEGSRSNAVDYSTGFSTTPASYTTIRELDYAISARGRLGFSPGDGRGLFYLTGGASYAKIDHEFETTNGANSFTLNDDNDMVWGWQAGAGAELMLTQNIGIGLEYLYSRYDDDKSS